MKNVISVIYSVCITFIMSSPQVTAEGLYPEIHRIDVISNSTFTSSPFTTYPSNTSSNCDYSSYPDFCIPASPPNLNCDDVDGNDFKVFSPDPHGFDRDKDGEGCETSE